MLRLNDFLQRFRKASLASQIAFILDFNSDECELSKPRCNNTLITNCISDFEHIEAFESNHRIFIRIKNISSQQSQHEFLLALQQLKHKIARPFSPDMLLIQNRELDTEDILLLKTHYLKHLPVKYIHLIYYCRHHLTGFNQFALVDTDYEKCCHLITNTRLAKSLTLKTKIQGFFTHVKNHLYLNMPFYFTCCDSLHDRQYLYLFFTNLEKIQQSLINSCMNLKKIEKYRHRVYLQSISMYRLPPLSHQKSRQNRIQFTIATLVSIVFLIATPLTSISIYKNLKKQQSLMQARSYSLDSILDLKQTIPNDITLYSIPSLSRTENQISYQSSHAISQLTAQTISHQLHQFKSLSDSEKSELAAIELQYSQPQTQLHGATPKPYQFYTDNLAIKNHPLPIFTVRNSQSILDALKPSPDFIPIFKAQLHQYWQHIIFQTIHQSDSISTLSRLLHLKPLASESIPSLCHLYSQLLNYKPANRIDVVSIQRIKTLLLKKLSILVNKQLNHNQLSTLAFIKMSLSPIHQIGLCSNVDAYLKLRNSQSVSTTFTIKPISLSRNSKSVTFDNGRESLSYDHGPNTPFQFHLQDFSGCIVSFKEFDDNIHQLSLNPATCIDHLIKQDTFCVNHGCFRYSISHNDIYNLLAYQFQHFRPSKIQLGVCHGSTYKDQL